jgi:hypothetical protein
MSSSNVFTIDWNNKNSHMNNHRDAPRGNIFAHVHKHTTSITRPQQHENMRKVRHVEEVLSGTFSHSAEFTTHTYIRTGGRNRKKGFA